MFHRQRLGPNALTREACVATSSDYRRELEKRVATCRLTLPCSSITRQPGMPSACQALQDHTTVSGLNDKELTLLNADRFSRNSIPSDPFPFRPSHVYRSTTKSCWLAGIGFGLLIDISSSFTAADQEYPYKVVCWIISPFHLILVSIIINHKSSLCTNANTYVICIQAAATFSIPRDFGV